MPRGNSAPRNFVDAESTRIGLDVLKAPRTREEVQHHLDVRLEVLDIASPRTLPAWRKRARGARERRRARGATATIAGNTPAHRAVVGHAPGEQEEGATAERATLACAVVEAVLLIWRALRAAARRSQPSQEVEPRLLRARRTSATRPHEITKAAMVIWLLQTIMLDASLRFWDDRTRPNRGQGRTRLGEPFPKPCRPSSNSKGQPNASGRTVPTSEGIAMGISVGGKGLTTAACSQLRLGGRRPARRRYCFGLQSAYARCRDHCRTSADEAARGRRAGD